MERAAESPLGSLPIELPGVFEGALRVHHSPRLHVIVDPGDAIEVTRDQGFRRQSPGAHFLHQRVDASRVMDEARPLARVR